MLFSFFTCFSFLCHQTFTNLSPNFHQTFTKLPINFLQTSNKLPSNFHQTSNKLSPNFQQTFTELSPSFLQTFSKLSPNFHQTSQFFQTFNDFSSKNIWQIFYLFNSCSSYQNMPLTNKQFYEYLEEKVKAGAFNEPIIRNQKKPE